METKDYYTEKKFASESKLVPEKVKLSVLNGIKQKIIEMQGATTDPVVMDALDVHTRLLEDAYNINMYKFQFKLLINILNKELLNLEKIIEFSE